MLLVQLLLGVETLQTLIVGVDDELLMGVEMIQTLIV